MHFIELINSTVMQTFGFSVLTETIDGQIVLRGTLV